MKRPPYVCFYRSFITQLEMFDDAACGRILKALLYFADDAPYEHLLHSPMEELAFSFFANQTERDFQKYDERCERNRQNALKRSRDEADEGDGSDGSDGCDGSQEKEKEKDKKREKKKNNKNENVKKKERETATGARANPSYDVDALSRFIPFVADRQD